jgi:hypothetical protein
MDNEFPGGQYRGPVSSEGPVSPAGDQSGLLYPMLSLALAGLVALSLGVTFVTWYQTRQVRRQLEQSRQAIAQYQRVEEPLVNDLLSKLEGFGLQNRDYLPILQKYAFLFPRIPQPASATPTKAQAISAAPAKTQIAPPNAPAAAPAPAKSGKK